MLVIDLLVTCIVRVVSQRRIVVAEIVYSCSPLPLLVRLIIHGLARRHVVRRLLRKRRKGHSWTSAYRSEVAALAVCHHSLVVGVAAGQISRETVEQCRLVEDSARVPMTFRLYLFVAC